MILFISGSTESLEINFSKLIVLEDKLKLLEYFLQSTILYVIRSITKYTFFFRQINSYTLIVIKYFFFFAK